VNTMPPRKLKGVVLLAAQTARSQTYIQVMAAFGLLPESVILMGEAGVAASVEKASLNSWNDILLPHLDESVSATCKRAGVDLFLVAENDVNAEATHQAICAAAPDIVIYSGMGGQIVSERTLALGPKFLHMHSGWLPEYRGSTTLYYSLLEGGLPGVSAIVLDREIDTGPVVARRQYPRPPAGMDLDRVYDAAIRADLMVRVLLNYKKSGSLPVIEHQNPCQGTPYYVIHPILKHLSILSLEENRHT